MEEVDQNARKGKDIREVGARLVEKFSVELSAALDSNDVVQCRHEPRTGSWSRP